MIEKIDLTIVALERTSMVTRQGRVACALRESFRRKYIGIDQLENGKDIVRKMLNES